MNIQLVLLFMKIWFDVGGDEKFVVHSKIKVKAQKKHSRKHRVFFKQPEKFSRYEDFDEFYTVIWQEFDPYFSGNFLHQL